MARQRLGQHFLADAGWREKIARAIRVSPRGVPHVATAAPHCWFEIGAGHGEMTEHLVKSGEPVCSVELDSRLTPRLRELSQQHPNLSVIEGDILKTELAALAAGRVARVYGNLPYYITSPILHHLFESARFIEEIHIVIQLEVAFRLVARPGTRDYGYLSVLTQFHSKASIALKIPPGAFRPLPKVASALVSMRLPGDCARLRIADEMAFFDFVKVCFAQKRKTILNNLRPRAGADQVLAALQKLGLKNGARAEELSVEELAGLYGELSAKSE